MPMTHNNDQTEKIFLKVKNSDTHILVVTNNIYLDLRLPQLRESTPGTYWKPSQPPRTSEIMDLRGVPITATFLNKHNP